ncbi:MAG: TOBE domain-containing protein, partial [Thermoleophilia bacterium]|nr:TOBE domain-containing protein [Thermoleophilia bacterium]
GARGLTEVTLDAGGVVFSTDRAVGRVAVAVYPWEVALSHGVPDDSAVNHLRAVVSSVVELGNRARVRVGPVTAEVTAASLARLGISVGDAVVATFKATAARLLPL